MFQSPVRRSPASRAGCPPVKPPSPHGRRRAGRIHPDVPESGARPRRTRPNSADRRQAPASSPECSNSSMPDVPAPGTGPGGCRRHRNRAISRGCFRRLSPRVPPAGPPAPKGGEFTEFFKPPSANAGGAAVPFGVAVPASGTSARSAAEPAGARRVHTHVRPRSAVRRSRRRPLRGARVPAPPGSYGPGGGATQAFRGSRVRPHRRRNRVRASTPDDVGSPNLAPPPPPAAPPPGDRCPECRRFIPPRRCRRCRLPQPAMPQQPGAPQMPYSAATGDAADGGASGGCAGPGAGREIFEHPADCDFLPAGVSGGWNHCVPAGEPSDRVAERTPRGCRIGRRTPAEAPAPPSL